MKLLGVLFFSWLFFWSLRYAKTAWKMVYRPKANEILLDGKAEIVFGVVIAAVSLIILFGIIYL